MSNITGINGIFWPAKWWYFICLLWYLRLLDVTGSLGNIYVFKICIGLICPSPSFFNHTFSTSSSVSTSPGQVNVHLFKTARATGDGEGGSRDSDDFTHSQPSQWISSSRNGVWLRTQGSSRHGREGHQSCHHFLIPGVSVWGYWHLGSWWDSLLWGRKDKRRKKELLCVRQFTRAC